MANLTVFLLTLAMFGECEVKTIMRSVIAVVQMLSKHYIKEPVSLPHWSDAVLVPLL